MPTFYADQRMRTLRGFFPRGLGATFYADQRMRTLRGLGDSTIDLYGGAFDPTKSWELPAESALTAPTAPDLGPAVPVDTTPIFFAPAPAPPLPAGTFNNPSPILPAATPQPAPVAPNLGPAVPQPTSFILPSGSVLKTTPVPAATTTSWLDQQMIAGVPNLYLLLGLGGAFLLFQLSQSKRRR